MKDKILWCEECHRLFYFYVGEQKFFAKRGFPNPIRCPSCRAEKKKRGEDINGWSSSYSMRRNSRPGHGYFRKLGGW